MKVVAAVLSASVGHLLLGSAEAAQLRRVSADISPVTRVVELLQGLSTKVEEEAQMEEDLYNKFVCWGKQIINEKTASNEKAKSRKESLETYVADLDAGRIELTTERVDLEKEIAGLSADIDTAEALRAKEHEDYLAAKTEMEQGKAALEKAIAVLESGTSGGAAGSLLRVDSHVSDSSEEGYAARAADAKALLLAVEIGQRTLSKGDALFLRRLLEGDVPEKDWKMLNKKPVFKEKYEARSGKIVDTLKRMLLTFTNKLEEVEATETKAQGTHDKLMTAKGDQKDKAQKALEAMEVEGSARSLSKSEAEAEIKDLGTQITDDEKYISDTQKALDDKKVEWAARSQIRTKELEAISKAIAVLHSDDARDLFKRSFKSQNYALVQESSIRRALVQRRSVSTKAARAAELLRASGNAKLAALVSAAGKGHFDAVIKAIDDMIASLSTQEDAELKNKEDCEKARADDTREAITVSRAMDELSDTITRLNSEIEELKTQIEEKKAEIVQINEALKEAKDQREAEHSEWVKSDKDDEDAIALIAEASDVLTQFYASVALVQRRKGHQEPEIKAGEAPPPPPATWEAPYTGKQDENTGVVAILGLIKEDVVKDREKAKTAEDTAESEYQTMKTEQEKQLETLGTEISDMEGLIGDKEGEVKTTKDDFATKKGELEVVMKRIKDAEPGCNFFTVHYEERTKKRQIERDGLIEAKAILSGATFDGL